MTHNNICRAVRYCGCLDCHGRNGAQTLQAVAYVSISTVKITTMTFQNPQENTFDKA